MSKSIKILIDIAAFLFVYARWLYKKWKHNGKNILLVNTLLYFYLVGVALVTLMPIITAIPFIFDHPYVPMNLNAYEDFFMGRGDTVRQIVLNVIMMIPFGFLLPIQKMMNAKECSIKCVLSHTIILSLSIELIQPLLHGNRSADITDIINNTIGGLIGYCIYLISRPLVSKIFMKN